MTVHRFWCKQCGAKIAEADNGLCVARECQKSARAAILLNTSKETLIEMIDTTMKQRPTTVSYMTTLRAEVLRSPFDDVPKLRQTFERLATIKEELHSPSRSHKIEYPKVEPPHPSDDEGIPKSLALRVSHTELIDGGREGLTINLTLKADRALSESDTNLLDAILRSRTLSISPVVGLRDPPLPRRCVLALEILAASGEDDKNLRRRVLRSLGW